MMKNDYQWRTGRYCVFKNFVHLVFTTKYRKGVFTKEMLEIMEVAVKDSCKKMGGELLEFGGEGDHVHLYSLVFCLFPTTFANRLPQPIPLPIIRSHGFRRAYWYYSVVRLLTEHRSPLRFRL